MKKNLWLLGLLVFIFASCDTGSEAADTWSDITSLHQLAGTWVGTQTRTVPLINILEEGGYPTADIKEIIKDIKVKIVVKTTVIIEADDDNEGTMSATINAIVSLFGGNPYVLDMVWGMMMDENMLENIYEDMPFDATIEIDDDNHSITMNSEEEGSITLDDIAPRFEINQTGTKLRADTSDLGGGFIPSEIILYKK